MALCLTEQHNILQVQTGAQQVVPQHLISSGSADLKDEEEDMNDVNVERERSVHVLLWTDCQLPVSDKKLGVVD